MLRAKLAYPLPAIFLALLLAACATPVPPEALKNHLSNDHPGETGRGTIPDIVEQTLVFPHPQARPKAETYSVVVGRGEKSDAGRVG